MKQFEISLKSEGEINLTFFAEFDTDDLGKIVSAVMEKINKELNQDGTHWQIESIEEVA